MIGKNALPVGVDKVGKGGVLNGRECAARKAQKKKGGGHPQTLNLNLRL